jgi:serine/threonine protein kinase
MKEMQEEHLVKLEEFTEDENFFYIVLEYCDEGDLLNLQMQQPEKVFPLQMAL